MNTNPPGHEDEPLRDLLKEWKATSDLPPGFQGQVWRRIERAKAQTIISPPLWTVCTNWIAAVLPRPVLAAAYLAAFLAIGATFGWAQARRGDLSQTRKSQDDSVKNCLADDPELAIIACTNVLRTNAPIRDTPERAASVMVIRGAAYQLFA